MSQPFIFDAHLDLWQDDRARAAQAGERRPPDAAWLRRAAILALLCIALAGPHWQRPAERVTVWIDDSLSMQTLEDGATRLDRGLHLVQMALPLHTVGHRHPAAVAAAMSVCP